MNLLHQSSVDHFRAATPPLGTCWLTAGSATAEVQKEKERKKQLRAWHPRALCMVCGSFSVSAADNWSRCFCWSEEILNAKGRCINQIDER